jgi:hypothetical protein
VIYKLLSHYFGWDYITSKYNEEGIFRVRVSHENDIYIWRWKGLKKAWIVENPKEWIWLTCNPEKYFPTDQHQTTEPSSEP